MSEHEGNLVPEQDQSLQESNLEVGVGKAQEFEPMKGYDLNNLAEGSKLEIRTLNSTYILEKRADGLYLSGGSLLPQPEQVSNVGAAIGTGIKQDFVGINLPLECRRADGKTLRTSLVKEAKEI